MDERDKEEQDLQAALPENQRCPFVIQSYWEGKSPSQEDQELYWCSIDLKKFYASLKLETVRENIVEHLPLSWQGEADLLLKSMLQFRLDTRGWSDDELKKIDLNGKRKTFSHIPTGLYVAGFLANAGLLKVDKKVQKRLTEHNIAHFRYVDDHIVLAYSFDELDKWVDLYKRLLNEENTGTRINLEKVEPKGLSEMLIRRIITKSAKKSASLKDIAIKDCRLDPQFPSPLMTKTITLVSGIARTDFNLLDSNELATLTDQLEHLLLADLPEEEMPARTRLSFASTRLTWVAERRLANDGELASLHCRRDRLEKRLKDINKCNKPSENVKTDLEKELREIRKDIKKKSDHIEREVGSAFQLLRKVLRDRPDRVRLWTRAVLMCRLTGVKGLQALKDDIERVRVKDKNPHSAQYLTANLLMLLGTQALIAGRILQDQNMARWRKEAAKKFLGDLCENHFSEPRGGPDHGILHYSWYVYSFGLYCAALVIQDKKISSRLHSITRGLTRSGLHYVARRAGKHPASPWAWWAARKTLRDLSSRADGLVLNLGHQLKGLPNAAAFWRFFPLDLPFEVVPIIATSDLNIPEGWWYDCLAHRKKGSILRELIDQKKGPLERTTRLLDSHLNASTESLYDWCHFVQEHAQNREGDPRFGEWTALEIVKQIANLVKKEPALVSYLSESESSTRKPLNLHPANFIVPSDWMNQDNQDNLPTWESWKSITKEKPIKWVSEEYRIED
ncbi:MAG: RNA-directed DNA polymerase, partial [Syntrophales bacterium LBB04]|nr:RNA-directed DNA polymerase [Syntrophales bacterium LBB04]